ncbi:MAG TPA: SprB repeat-containing protein, partial [Saprospiraceae bacterium]
MDTLQVAVNANNAPVIDVVVIEDATCGNADGSLTVQASGGTGGLEYSLDGIIWQDSPIFVGLPAGAYTVHVRDDAGCPDEAMATILDIGAPEINDIIMEPTPCGIDEGSITILAEGNSTLMYSINCINYVSTNVFEHLPAGNYTICVRDQNGCLTIQQVIINTLDGPQIDDVEFTATTCGDPNGTITVEASGGMGILEYSIDGINWQDSPIFTELPAGDYVVQIRDENGCPAQEQVSIGPSEGPDLDVYPTPAHCGQADGCIILDGSGGRPPYTYSITGGEPFGQASEFCDLPSDDYMVAIKDANGCIYVEEEFLWEIGPPVITNILIPDLECGQEDGQVVVTAVGIGDLSYSIQLPFFQDSGIFNNVLPGTYTVTVRDQWGCEDTGTAVVLPKPAPNLSVNPNNPDCGVNNGSITASATGGLPPYMYSLNNGAFGSNNVFSGLPAGIHTIMVKGSNDCQDTLVVDLRPDGTEFGALSASVCENDTLFIEGNILTQPGTYAIPIPGGASNGCDSILNVTLAHNPFVEKTITEAICRNKV